MEFPGFLIWLNLKRVRVVLASSLPGFSYQNFPQFVVIHTVKGSSIVNEVDVFLKFLCFLYDPTNVGNLISGSSAFSKPRLYNWKFWIHILLKPLTVWITENCGKYLKR